MTLTAAEFAEVKRIGQALDHLVSGLAEVGLQLERVANSLEEIKQATVEEIVATAELEEEEEEGRVRDLWGLQGLSPDPITGGL